VAFYDYNGPPATIESYTTSSEVPCIITLPSYSSKAILGTLILGFCIVVSLVGLGFLRYNGKMVLMRNNSLVISAACHPLQAYTRTSRRPVMWGAVFREESGDRFGHCSFTNRRVEDPIVGQRYAGLRVE
jgi:hypothetical protein